MNQLPEPQRVLLVEDDEKLRGLLTKQLRRKGYVVTEAPDAETVLRDWVDMGVYDLVLTDVHLPGKSGVELVRQLNTSEGDNTPVVFVTGDTDEEMARNAIDGGAAGYLLKPFEFFELDAMVRNVLSRPGTAVAKAQPTTVATEGATGRDLAQAVNEQRALHTFRIAVQRPARIVLREGRTTKRRAKVGLKAVAAVAACLLFGWLAGKAAYTEDTGPIPAAAGVAAPAAAPSTVFFPVIVESQGGGGGGQQRQGQQQRR